MPESPTDARLRTAILAQLTPDEIRACVVYVASEPIAAGTTVALGRIAITLPWEGHLAFVDLDPMANWSHRCRYVGVRTGSSETVSEEAQLPPFGARKPGEPPLRWRVLYRAADVPAAVLAVPEDRQSNSTRN